MNRSYKDVFKLVLAIFIVFVSSHNAYSQTEIKGTVVDSKSGEPIVGAIVYEQSKSSSALTDIDGNFVLSSNKSLPMVIAASFVGYLPFEVNVFPSANPIVIKLVEEEHEIDEVVVVGYGTQKRTQLTGAVTSLSADVIENNTAPTIDGLLSGAVPGISVTASSQPGGSSSIRIRGGNSVNASNEPLYVIDGLIYFQESTATGLGGIEGSISPLAMINPNDIEGVEVLKDISATAIYGSRGANGVIIVTTKKGKRGSSELKYEYNLSIAKVAKKLSLLNASQWARIQKTYFRNRGKYTDEQIDALGEGTDWQNAVLQTSISQSHNVTLSGGNEKTRFLLAANRTAQDGVVINSDFSRNGLRLNIDHNVSEFLIAGGNANISKSVQNGLTTTSTTSYNSSPYSAGITSSLTYALFMPPVVDIYNADGTYNYKNPYEYAYFAVGDHAANPVSDLKNSVAENENHGVLGNLYLNLLVKDFSFKGTLAFDVNGITQNFFAPSYTAIGMAEEGVGGIGKRHTETWQTEYLAQYNHEFAEKHQVDAMLGYTWQKTTRSNVVSRTSHYANETLQMNNLAAGTSTYTPVSGRSSSELYSAIFRLNYTLLNRYNLTATYRADHSSKFSENHRWGHFPSLGLSWNVDKESFIQNIDWISTLKLRASFGTVGNQEIGDYQYETTYSMSSTGGTASYSKTNAANADLKWETTASYNVGLDWGLLGNKVNLVADVYYKKTNDLLMRVSIDSSNGVSSQLQNIGNVENRGVELGLKYDIINSKDLNWSVSANIAHNENALTNLGKGRERIISGSNKILKKNEAVGSFYGLIFDGVVQSDEDTSLLPTQNGARLKPGDAKFRDVNGDKKIDSDDRTIIGTTHPDITYGLTSTLRWKNLDLYVQIQGSKGQHVYNLLRWALEHPTDCYNTSSVLLDAWTETNPSKTVPKITDLRPFSYVDTRYVEDASYIRLKNVSLGYNVPLNNAVPVKVRLTASAQNLLTITDYKGYDPEVKGNTDDGTYPAARTFSFGVAITY